ncbi:MAG: hypothetical protein HeimC3_53830 [Candidatus Heimdallarchaeota archaeon LC_3]|nr:MAG: hypothetical protein HeimC3_53830 [Candidatus Heimdallarchaeota archaeon LC_3]
MTNYQLSFTKEFESHLINYLDRYPNLEVFLGLIGKIIGKKDNVIQFSVSDGLPFPNTSPEKKNEVVVTKDWLEIMKEYSLFIKRSKNSSLRLLGALHTHPGSIPSLSSIDKNFGFQLANELGNAIMIIVGKNKSLYTYFFSQNEILKIKHISKKFLKRYII